MSESKQKQNAVDTTEAGESTTLRSLGRKLGRVAKATTHVVVDTDLRDVGHVVQGGAVVTATVVRRPFRALSQDARDARTLARAAKIMTQDSDKES